MLAIYLLSFHIILGTPLVSTPIWGVSGGESRAELLERFEPLGTTTGSRWTSEVTGSMEVLRYTCSARNRCFSHPSRAEFFLHKGRLAAFSFFFSRESGPENTSVRAATGSVMAKAGFLRPTTIQTAVGRRSQYFLTERKTVLWVQDGPDAEIKLYVDELNPVGRAEAVTAGAKVSLKHLLGAEPYSRAHGHILGGRFDKAKHELEVALKIAGQSAFLKRQVRYVLAMVIAAQVKTGLETPASFNQVWASNARKSLLRAIDFAPSLRPHLERLMDQISSKSARP